MYLVEELHPLAGSAAQDRRTKELQNIPQSDSVLEIPALDSLTTGSLPSLLHGAMFCERKILSCSASYTSAA
jgi:hypothetical protein